MVTVLSSPQRLGTIGSALSGNSVRKPVELAHLLQERLVVLDADGERHARGADVGRIGEDLRHGQHAAFRVEIVNRELAEVQRHARVEGGIEIDLAGIERHRQRQRLEGRAHLVARRW